MIYRLNRYYKENGFVKTFRHILSRAGEKLCLPPYVLFTCDLRKDVSPLPSLPEGYEVLCRGASEELTEEERQLINKNRGTSKTQKDLAERFGKGSKLWLLKRSGCTVGMIWSLEAATVRPYFWILQPGEAHLYDNEIFFDYRGKGFNSILLRSVVARLREHGLNRLYIETLKTNAPEQRSLMKNGFLPISQVRQLLFGPWNMIVFSPLKPQAPKSAEPVVFMRDNQ